MTFERDPNDWLRRLSPDEWIAAAMNELKRAEEAYLRHDPRGGLAGAKRAAGMALNGALLTVPNETWGRSYVDHIAALIADESAPAAVRSACKTLHETPAPGSIAQLRTKSGDEKVLEAARDVMAHALAIVMRGKK